LRLDQALFAGHRVAVGSYFAKFDGLVVEFYCFIISVEVFVETCDVKRGVIAVFPARQTSNSVLLKQESPIT